MPMVTVTVGVDTYLLGEVQTVLDPITNDSEYIPATLMDLDVKLSAFEEDDVWTNNFLTALIIPRSRPKPPGVGQALLYHIPDDADIPIGPYIIHSYSGRVFRVCRLFNDTSDAFIGGVLPSRASRFQWYSSTNLVPIPSRLYNKSSSASKPLAGLRFGVKDAIDVAGLQTGVGSKCYRDFYSVKETTAPCIQYLISAGAVLVGKLRCCQWCDGQDPLERLEEFTPLNPRGDGFQKPSSSSSGSASACASYSWLDFTVGTDTGGSIRHPAGVNGVYGIRPSLGLVQSAGLICTALMDTVGVFTRSAKTAELVTPVLAGGTMKGSAGSIFPRSNATTTKRFKLLYAVMPHQEATTSSLAFFPSQKPNPETSAQRLMSAFTERLENYLGCTRTPICIYDLWTETHPEGTASDLVEATSRLYNDIVYGTMWRDVVGPFLREYVLAYGQEPFIEPVTRARLESGASLSSDELHSAIAIFHVYAKWLNETLLPGPTDSQEIPLLIYPQSAGHPQYRDEVSIPRKDRTSPKFSVYSISYCSGCPDITVPIGEVTFTSKFTGSEKYLPVAVSLLVPRGMDLELLGLLSGLESAGIIQPVDCGSRMFRDV
ncbi:hypothetical protein SCAR479_02418 [Seiridium cardinale]|uniref:Amidase domain-containing protein n=1 Tax=Seiridium cardinale TaxID=138064 RepID=A0ABR2X5W6_9PEZI